MLEHITLEMVVTGVFIVAANIITLKWIRRDLNKHDKHIESLFERTGKMMSKNEIALMVKEVIHPVQNELTELKSAVSAMAGSVHAMSISVARMDERQKIATENLQKRASDAHN